MARDFHQIFNFERLRGLVPSEHQPYHIMRHPNPRSEGSLWKSSSVSSLGNSPESLRPARWRRTPYIRTTRCISCERRISALPPVTSVRTRQRLPGWATTRTALAYSAVDQQVGSPSSMMIGIPDASAEGPTAQPLGWKVGQLRNRWEYYRVMSTANGYSRSPYLRKCSSFAPLIQLSRRMRPLKVSSFLSINWMSSLVQEAI